MDTIQSSSTKSPPPPSTKDKAWNLDDARYTAIKYSMQRKQTEAYQSWLSITEKCDDPEAQYEVGVRMKEGRGTERNYEQAVYWLGKAAEQHHPRAHVELGKLYALGLGVKKNFALAITHFKTAADLKNPYALCELGKLYVLGYGQDSDYVGFEDHYAAAKDCFEKAMEAGVPEAQCELGKLYLYGCGVPPDFSVALVHIQAAAEQEVPEALFRLGMMYQTGLGVDPNGVTAAKKYQAAADLGSPSAMNNLGCMYTNGEGVEKNHVTAATYYRQSAELGQRAAMHNLGTRYVMGEGVDKNQATAVTYFRQSAALGEPLGLFKLGERYLFGTDGVEQDNSAAIDCFRRAAELGDRESWDALKFMQEKGLGDVRDYAAARVYYEHAHTQGLPAADAGRNSNDYGYDDTPTFRYYQKAAEQNDPRAFYNLGMLYLEGRGVEKNLPIAVTYLEQAAQLGDTEAEHRISRLLDDDTQAQVIAAYAEVAKENKTWALLRLGQLFVDGTLVKRDCLNGFDYLETLVGLKDNQNLSVADKSCIVKAEELLKTVVRMYAHYPVDAVTQNPFYLNDSTFNELL